MLIDRLLYLAVPKALHRWASENRAKVRSYGVAWATPVAAYLVDRYVAAEWKVQVLAALGSLAAVVAGRATHNVVTPWEQDA